MGPSVSVFCPGHISGYFKRVIGQDAATTGSIGAGIVITEGVVARVQPAGQISICICRRSPSGPLNEISRESELITSTMERLSITASVTTECRLPIGAGFGLSAAALLATLTALNRLCGLGMTEMKIATIAHEAEIYHRTGLGDVSACRGGGFVVRTTAGIAAPVLRYFGFPEPIYAVSFGPIHTPSILGSQQQMEKVELAFPDYRPVDIENFFRCSQIFTRSSGLLTPKVQKVLERCDERGIPASMTMLGDGVFAYGKNAKRVLSQFGMIYEMHVATQGARVVEEIS
ncbi:MAG: pantoate kinase [Methanoregula sp.]|nr:pantoate kinase [Methanoregula sp.]